MVVDKNNYIVPQVDSFPEILINDLTNALRSMGYDHLIEYSEFEEFRCNHILESILKSKKGDFWAHARILTPDKNILIVTDFDQRFSYLSSTKEIITKLIMELELEGFFCNESTHANWS
jgi:hypothetical protein